MLRGKWYLFSFTLAKIDCEKVDYRKVIDFSMTFLANMNNISHIELYKYRHCEERSSLNI